MPVLIDNTDDTFLFVNADDNANGAVHPALLFVVLGEDNLCSGLHFQLHRSG